MKTLKGTVVSAKTLKTAVVVVERMWQHPLYKKTVRRSKKYLVHDDIGVKTGDKVTIQESRPMSKNKRWIVNKIEK